MTDQPHILFLCTGNSARSIIAEAIANQQFGSHLRACSAGSNPAGEVHPQTIETLKSHGLKTDGLSSKRVDAVGSDPIDLIISLCDSARDQPCPTLPGGPVSVHWPLPDPPAAENPDGVFETVFEALNKAIGLLVNTPDESLSARASMASRELNQRFAPRVI